MKQESIIIKTTSLLLWQFDSVEDREEWINYNDYEVSYKCKGEDVKESFKMTDDEYLSFIYTVSDAGHFWDFPSKRENFNPQLTLIFEI